MPTTSLLYSGHVRCVHAPPPHCPAMWCQSRVLWLCQLSPAEPGIV